MSNQELDVLIGTVVRYYPAEINDAGNWKPAKLVLDTDEVSGVEVSFWPKKDNNKVVIEPIEIPVLDAIDVETIEGKEVQIVCVFQKIYKRNNGDEIHQYSSARKVKVIGENAPTKPKPKPQVKADEPEEETSEPTPAPAPVRPTIEENQMRIMRQSTLGYSSNQLQHMNFATPQDMVLGTIEVARLYLDYVITGESPSFEEEEEPEQEESDGVIDVDGEV
jgi:hypothetical protein